MARIHSSFLFCAKKSHGIGGTPRACGSHLRQCGPRRHLMGGGCSSEEPRKTQGEQNQNSALLPFSPGLLGHLLALSQLPQLYSTVARAAHQEPGSRLLPTQVFLLFRNPHPSFRRCLLSSQALRNLSDLYGFAPVYPLSHFAVIRSGSESLGNGH